MIQTIVLQPGVTLRCFPDKRFKQACLSLQFVRPMCREEAPYNALLPEVLLRGTQQHPDLRDITLRLDDLYGASVGALVRRVGDYQTTGLHCSFIEDAYALDGDAILEPMIDFLRELLLEPALENGVFRQEYVESEKRNLILAIESQRNDKRAYAAAQMLKTMCREDAFGVPRLGDKELAAAIDAQSLYAHYCRILKESRIELFYVGSAQPSVVAELLRGVFEGVSREYRPLPEQTPLRVGECCEKTEEMEIAQGKLAVGMVTPITFADPRFAAMQLCNTIFGGGMTSKLFMQIREKQSLCYDIGSGYYGTKGIVSVSAGIDCDQKEPVLQRIKELLEDCVNRRITDDELTAAKQALLSSLRGTHDSPNAIESYYTTAALSGLGKTPAEYMQALEQVTLAQVAEAAATVRVHTVYFLKGVQ